MCWRCAGTAGRSAMAFQISDDIIDICSTDSGKTPGTDLREGVPTLPVLYTLADPAADPRLRELVVRSDHAPRPSSPRPWRC